MKTMKETKEMKEMKEIEFFNNYYIYQSGAKYYIEQDEDLMFDSLDAARAKVNSDPYDRSTYPKNLIIE